jgi:hypothetical protein
MLVVTVEDYGTRGTPTGADPDLLEQLSTQSIKPHRFREYDVGNPEWKKWQSQVDAVSGPPAAFFLDFKTKTPVGKPTTLVNKKWTDLKALIDKYTAE